MLQILCGPDRTANSMRILDQICENARAGVAGQILIVPEQYSHETERALCARGGDTISRYAEVLSFTRLAARVFSVCGGVCEEYLDENGRVLTLYLAAQQVREQLTFYAAVMTRPDFLRQLGALMEELLTSCIPPDALHAAAARSIFPPRPRPARRPVCATRSLRISSRCRMRSSIPSARPRSSRGCRAT